MLENGKFYGAEEASEEFIEVMMETTGGESLVFWVSLSVIPPQSDLEDSSIRVALKRYYELYNKKTKNILEHNLGIKNAFSYSPFSRYLYEVIVIK